MGNYKEIEAVYPELAQAIEAEHSRQSNHIELIASENWVSKAVLEATGTILTNKYAEGYPSKRYYGGCACVDEVESMAIEGAKKLFNCEYANVQPHSGSQANLAAFYAILDPFDTYLGMGLDQGGHLSHGSPVNISGKYFKAVSYGLDENGYIDYDEVRKIALEHKPKLILSGASAYSRIIDFKKFREICDEVGAVMMVDMAHIAGLVAAGVHPSPFPYADVVTTTTHKTLRGPRGGLILANNSASEKYNFNKAIFPGVQGGPLMHVIAAKAVCFKEAMGDDFISYQQQIVKNAKTLSDALMQKGNEVVSKGTDNHLFILDLSKSQYTGKDMEKMLDSAGITVNKNTIPNEKRSPFVTSGVRIGTPAVTTRGFKEEDMLRVADAIDSVLKNGELGIDKASKIVKELTSKYPLS